jgi:hypothetical protein
MDGEIDELDECSAEYAEQPAIGCPGSSPALVAALNRQPNRSGSAIWGDDYRGCRPAHVGFHAVTFFMFS